MEIQKVHVIVNSHIENMDDNQDILLQENDDIPDDTNDPLVCTREVPLTNSPKNESDDANEMQIICDGQLYYNEGNFQLSYDELLENGSVFTETTITFHTDTPKIVHISRNGMVSSELILQKGKTHDSLYINPYGTLQVSCTTLDVQNDLIPDGNLHLEYVLKIGETAKESCMLDIVIQPIEQDEEE